jgi:hypothetical protein
VTGPIASISPPKGSRRRAGQVASVQPTTAGDFGREHFRFSLMREVRQLTTLNLDPFVEGTTWDREGGIKTGTLNFRRPLTGMQAGTIAEGDRVVCEVDLHGLGQWQRLWEMSVDTPSHQIVSGAMSLQLKSGLKTSQQSKAAFKFRNLTARQITLAVARRFRIKVGVLPTTKFKIDKLVRKSASPYDVIVDAWADEKKHSGRRFDIDLSRGLIDVVEQRDPAYMLMIGRAIIEATVTQPIANMASAVEVTSTRKVKGRKKKLIVTVVDHRRVKRYGYIVKQVNKANLNSVAACRTYGLRWLADHAKLTSDVTFSHPGIPFLEKGAAINLYLAAAAINQRAFIKSTKHSLSPGSYTMDVTVGFSDPWVDIRKERAKAKRDAAAKKRKRATVKKTTVKPATYAKAARRR